MKLDLHRIAAIAKMAAASRAILQSLAEVDASIRYIADYLDDPSYPKHAVKELEQWVHHAREVGKKLPLPSSASGKSWTLPRDIAKNQSDPAEALHLHRAYESSLNRAINDIGSASKKGHYQELMAAGEKLINSAREFMKLAAEFNRDSGGERLQDVVADKAEIDTRLKKFEKSAELLRMKILGAPDKKLDMRFWE